MAKRDLANYHELVSDLFKWPQTIEEWDQYKLSEDQLDFYKEFGYLSGVKLLDEQQIDVLLQELKEIINPNHPEHDLFYEFHSNESSNSDDILFHSLGH